MNNNNFSEDLFNRIQPPKRARKEKTVPVLVRINETWLKALNYLALDHQRRSGKNTTGQDLIRAAVEKCFINRKSITQAMSHEGAFTEKEVFEMSKKLLSMSGQPNR